ncbi:MAG: hypothetical protein ABF709_03375 [Leuconostoc pseudomesenteroides]|uniref:hypothetical protein n=1 Tax=Leuconostoc pseudomesenteroides TaxID=33968 RepID=UPI001E34F4A5|nr:hypothetical protein [Leuconostoc pseudomesenteroides]MCC7668029.1 hypothetical protein [Leuconostoc pseudomesenteroides]
MKKIKNGSNDDNQYLKLLASIKDYVVTAQWVEFMVLVQTTDYAGNVVAAQIDQLEIPEIVSTLAGINNIMIICENSDNAETVFKAFQKLSQNKI